MGKKIMLMAIRGESYMELSVKVSSSMALTSCISLFLSSFLIFILSNTGPKNCMLTTCIMLAAERQQLETEQQN